MKYVVTIAGDIHTGSTTALCPPDFRRDDGDRWQPSKGQEWLWEQWLAFCDAAQETAKRHGAQHIFVINGESVDKNWHKTSQTVSTNMSDIVRLGRMVLQPARDAANEMVFLRGTEAHVGTNGELDELLASMMGAVPEVGTGQQARWYWNDEVCGVRFDVAHHPGAGSSRESAAGRPVLTMAHEVILRNSRLGLPRPHLIVRGHNHVPGDTGSTLFTADTKTRAYILPGWQLPNSFTHRIGGSELPVGGLIVLCENGEWEATDWRAYLVANGQRGGIRKWG